MNRGFFSRFDLTLFLTTILLVATGIVAIYSATFGGTSITDFYVKQMIFGLVGFAIVIVLTYLPPRYIAQSSYILYIVSIIMLLLVLKFGKIINGNRSWFYIGGFGIQPSEFAKIATVLALSNFLSNSEEKKDPNRFFNFARAGLIVAIPFVLIKLQPDTGTSLVFLSIIIPVLFWAGLNPFWVLVLLSPALIAILAFLGKIYFIAGLFLILIAMFFFKKGWLWSSLILGINAIIGFSVNILYLNLKPYQQKRIEALFDPSADPLGSGYNVIQAKVAIGSGGLFGKGFLAGSQTQLKFIPEQWTDFIYCMIGEEFGFIGAIIVLVLYSIIIVKFINNASLSKNRFLSLSCIGFATIFLVHVTINVGMTIGVMPVIGIPLPMLSYGISSLLSFLFMIGIGMNAYRNRNIYMT
ncbi:rod shape-determining protein RodA [soil metagenome]